ncbi:hypothetical protein E2C01_063502 [Portunus trituberculatus]|uniref:Uncharacterized protein n=1 Tax=Portunus trituberculatus TaxID=210409 RepID=A0A5B7HL17_PORTR|nr:hypothetical protein [Portunus trituberculatus]
MSGREFIRIRARLLSVGMPSVCKPPQGEAETRAKLEDANARLNLGRCCWANNLSGTPGVATKFATYGAD